VNNGAHWLTVPLVKSSRDERICDKLVNNEVAGRENWQRRHWETLRTHYGRTPHFARYAPELEAVFARSWTRLVDLDLHMLKLHLDWFGIHRPVVLASSLELQGKKTERIVDLCKKIGARTYLSGAGGSRGYLELSQFADAGVSVAWQSYSHPEYPQRYPQAGFVSHLAALDALFNCGPESRGFVIKEEVLREQAV
jgi:hypothetical protein